jgi:hypothetical protein
MRFSDVIVTGEAMPILLPSGLVPSAAGSAAVPDLSAEGRFHSSLRLASGPEDEEEDLDEEDDEDDDEDEEDDEDEDDEDDDEEFEEDEEEDEDDEDEEEK